MLTQLRKEDLCLQKFATFKIYETFRVLQFFRKFLQFEICHYTFLLILSCKTFDSLLI